MMIRTSFLTGGHVTPAQALTRAAWLQDADERPHRDEPVLNWSENYLTYAWSPATGVGVYFHVTRLPGALARWEEIMYVALPDGRWLASRSTSPRRDVNGVEINGIQWRCDVPFQSWTKRFNGAAYLVTTEELEAGPLPDGSKVAVQLELECRGMSGTYDWGTDHLEQSWATGHYEQHCTFTGQLRFDGETVPFNGTGLRDHSWGPRDYTKLGSSTWISAQFPQSGRHFMVARVTGVPPAPELVFGVAGDRDRHGEVTPSDLLIARRFQDADRSYELQLTAPDSTVSTIQAEILRSTRCSFHGQAQMILGIDNRPIANHHYVDGFTRFDWDGEIGYGVTEYTVDLTRR
jgi:hypothetical protein